MRQILVRIPWQGLSDIHEIEIFGKLKGPDQSPGAILADSTHRKTKIQSADSTDEKVRLAQALGIGRLAAGASRELDAVFAELFA